MSIDKNLPRQFAIKNVSIFGYADAPEDGPLFKAAVEVSKTLAQAGITIIDGGGPGVMRAATVGAKLVNGRVIGVTLYPSDMTHFEGKDPRNMFDVEIRTHNYLERTLTLLKEGQAYVVFKGGTGTISEFAMAWGLARLYFGHHKPLILYGKFWHKIMKAFKENMNLRPEELKVYKIVDSPEQVLEALEEFEEELKHGRHEYMQLSTEDTINYSVNA